MLSSVQYASIRTFISSELNNNQTLSNSDSISSLLQNKHNPMQDNEKKLKLSYDFSNLLTCPKQSKPVTINIGNIKQPYPNSYRTVKQQHVSTGIYSNTNNNNNSNNHNGKDVHSLYTIIKPNHNSNNNNKKYAHSKESKTQSNSKSTSRDRSNHKANHNSCNYNYNYVHHHNNKHLCSSDNNKMNSNVITSYNNKKHTPNTLKQTFSDNSGGPLLNEKLFSKLNLKPYTTSTSNNNNSNSNNMNTPSSIVNTTTSIIKTKDSKKQDNTSINLNIYCHNNNIKNVRIKQIHNSSKVKKATSNTSHSNSNTNRSHYHSSINSYRSNRLGKKSNANINITNANCIPTTTTANHKNPKQNTIYLIPKKKLNKSKQEHTNMVTYNNGQLPLMIVNKQDKERVYKGTEGATSKHKHESYEVIEHIREEYIDLSQPEEAKQKAHEHKENPNNECKKEDVVLTSSSVQAVKENKKVSRKASSKHSRDQNTKSNNKNTKNEEIMKQIKNSLDDNLKVMFNFSYENFLSKESETESKKSSEQEILITESYET